MILGFKEFFDIKKKEPTYFREKILSCTGTTSTVVVSSNFNVRTFETTNLRLNTLKPKIHTIRKDKNGRWKPGMSIQMVYRGAGYKIKDEFNKGIPELQTCKAVQKIEIVYGDSLGPFHPVIVAIDKRILNESERLQLAINDGFLSLEDFFDWFDKDFTGKIIHWTNFHY